MGKGSDRIHRVDHVMCWFAICWCAITATVQSRADQAAVDSASAEPPNLAQRQSGEDWPTFLGPRGDSTSIETGIIRDWHVTPPRVVWTLELGESYGICSIARGRCFQFDRVDDFARLRCLHSETGEQLWVYQYPTDYRDAYGYNDGPRCSPIVDGNRVYIYGAEGELHCVRADNGRGLWKVDTVAEYGVVQNFFGVGSNPVVWGDLLIVMVGGSTPETEHLASSRLDAVVGDGSGIVAFDKYSGKERYRVSDELASYASLRLASIDEQPWLFAFARGGLLGLRPRDGRKYFYFPWRAKILESVNASVPVVVGNQVFISETYGPGSALLEVSPRGHKVVWADDSQQRARAMQTHWNTAIHVDGYVYGSSGRHSRDAELRCVQWNTGKVMWSQPGLLRSSLLYVDGHFVCLSEDGALSLIEAIPDKFTLISHLPRNRGTTGSGLTVGNGPPLTYPAWAAPILSHGLLYVRGKGRLVCLELIIPKPS